MYRNVKREIHSPHPLGKLLNFTNILLTHLTYTYIDILIMLMAQSVKSLAPVVSCETIRFKPRPDTFYQSHLPQTVSVHSARVNSLWKGSG